MSKKETVAVIDVGSNSIKLLVAQQGSAGCLIECVCTKTFETRISAGIAQEAPKLSSDAIDAGCQSIEELVTIARDYDPKIVKIVATSAVRDATNRIEFVERIKNAIGIELDILSGMEEATFIGNGLRCDPKVAALRDFVQMDIGGGSLELIRFRHTTIEKVCSLQLGAVRLTEKFVSDRTIAINQETETRIRAHVKASIEDSGFDFEPLASPMIVTGGAFSAIGSMLTTKAGMVAGEPDPVIHRKDIKELKSTLCHLSLLEREALPGLPKARADVMPTALITIDAVLELAGRDSVTCSSFNLRYGIAIQLLE